MKKVLISILAIFGLIIGISNISVTAAERTPVPHWQKSPITVYIPSENKKTVTMRKAFSKWQNSCGGKLKFKFVEEGPADIDVAFIENAKSSSSPISSHSTQTQGNTITKGEIRIATENPKFKKYSSDFVYTAMLHEIGGVLGLPTNNKRTSIMHTPVTTEQDILKIDVRKLYYINNWSYTDRYKN